MILNHLTKLLALKVRTLYIIFIVLPTLTTFIYSKFVATKFYESESLFFLKSNSKSSSDDINSIILSKDAFKWINDNINYEKIHQSKAIDFLNRMSISEDQSYEYFKNHVQLVTNNHSSINKLIVQSISYELAQQINDFLVKYLEQKLDKVNNEIKLIHINYMDHYNSILKNEDISSFYHMVIINKSSSSKIPMYPNTLKHTLSAFTLSLALFFIFRLMIAITREHNII